MEQQQRLALALDIVSERYAVVSVTIFHRRKGSEKSRAVFGRNAFFALHALRCRIPKDRTHRCARPLLFNSKTFSIAALHIVRRVDVGIRQSLGHSNHVALGYHYKKLSHNL